MNFVQILLISGSVILGMLSLVVLSYYVSDAIKYARDSHNYGKIEGDIIAKNTEMVMTPAIRPPYQYCFTIEKNQGNKKITRRLYVDQENYDKFNVGDHFNKD